MNKVFKVIWSEARNAYVVVSEMAKSHGTKSCSTKKLLAMLIATGIMTCASAAPVMAEDAVNLAPDATKIAIGEGAVASGKGSVVAIGQKASASGEGSVAIGKSAVASGLVGIAIGRDAVASGVDSIAIGGNTKATQTYSVAVGNDIGFTAYAGTAVGQQAYASGNNATAIGTMTNVDAEYNASHGDWRKAGARSTAIGAYAGSWGVASTAVGSYSKAEGQLATAIGYKSQANVDYGTALGDYSEVKAGWGVAIGASSVADRKSRVVGLYAPDEDKDSLTWKANAGAVSVGSSVEGEEITRQITNVAAGSADTDAVNVAQLNAVKAAAGKKVSLSNGKNTTVESTVKDGQTDYKVNVAGDLTDITSVANGDSKINLNKDSIIISNGNKYFAITNSGIGMSYIGADYSAKSIMLGENGTTISGGLNVAGSKITGVAAGVADTDAVNVGQLNAAVQAGNTDTHIKAGEYGVGKDNKVNMQLVDKNGKDAGTVTITDVAKASDVGNVNNIASDIKNQDGSHTTVVDAVNNLNQKLDNKVGDLNYVEGGKGNYVTNGENTTTSIGKLDQALKDVADTANQGWNLSTNGGEASKVAPGKTVDFSGDKNIKISNDGTNVKVELNNNIDVNTVKANSVTTGQTVMDKDGLKVGTDVSLNKDGLKVGKDVSVTATAVTAGKTSISDEGVKVGDKTYISADGLNANGQHITNVKAGEADTDAVNYGQLKDTNNRINGVENQVISNSNRINQLGNRVNKVGAGAAALAALHPMDFDPDDKLTFSAGYGNYGGENAAAIGAYYRPDEKVMFSVAGTVGNGENMVNAGVSFALDRTNHVSNSRTALAREVIDLRGQLAVMGAKMAKMEKAFGMLDETKTKLFPDVPANHWAYEYIAKLAGNGYIEGYPDGNFGGDRLMTRYEFAAMLYRAIEKGAALEEKIIKEFEPELGRIRVDRISGEDGDRDKIERVRVNDTKGERDHYGNKLAK